MFGMIAAGSGSLGGIAMITTAIHSSSPISHKTRVQNIRIIFHITTVSLNASNHLIVWFLINRLIGHSSMLKRTSSSYQNKQNKNLFHLSSCFKTVLIKAKK